MAEPILVSVLLLCLSLLLCIIPPFFVFPVLFFQFFPRLCFVRSSVLSCPFSFFVHFSVQFPPCLSPRPFSGFYNAREGLVSLLPETAGIVEARDHGHRGYSGCDCWIFPVKPASSAQNIGDDEQCFQNGAVVSLGMTVFQFGP